MKVPSREKALLTLHFLLQKSKKVAKIRNRYNQVPHLTQDTNGKVTNSQKTPQTLAKRPAPPPPPPPPPPAGDHKAHTNRRAQNIANTRQNKNIKDPQKKYRPGTVSKIFHRRAQTGPTAPTSPPTQMRIKSHKHLARTKDPQPTNAPSPKTYKSRHNNETKQGQEPNSKLNRTPEQKKSNRQTPAGPTNSQSTRPPPSHQQTSPQAGTTTEPEVRPIGAQPKRKAKPPTATGPTTKHAVRCNTLTKT